MLCAASQAHLLQNPYEISTIASSTAGILVADINGNIYLLNREFDPVRTWVAHVSGRVTHMVEKKGILVTLGVCSSFPHISQA